MHILHAYERKKNTNLWKTKHSFFALMHVTIFINIYFAKKKETLTRNEGERNLFTPTRFYLAHFFLPSTSPSSFLKLIAT